MKKILPYLFLIMLAIPQFNWIGKCACFVKAEKSISLFLAEEIEDFSEEEPGENSESESETESKSESEKESESKKLFLDKASMHNLWSHNLLHDKLLFRYVNHYDFSFSTINILPPELS